MGRKQKLKQQRRIEDKEKQKAKKRKTALFVYIFLAVAIAIIVLIIFLVRDNPAAQDDGLFDSGGGLMDVNKNSLDQISDSAGDNVSQADALVVDQTEALQATITTDKGDIKLNLYPKNAPNTVANFVKLANQGFYNQTTFHRVISDFMIQGGDPLSKDDDPNNDGTGGPGYSFADEINPWSLGLSDEQIQELEAKGYQYREDLTSLPNVVGAISMANAGPNTNGSQFFIITQQDQTHLNGLHTVFGKVTDGMDMVRSIEKGDKIINVEIAK